MGIVYSRLLSPKDSVLGNNAELDRLVMDKLGPWDSARLACVSRDFRRLEAENPQHWLVEMEDENRLWMINLVTLHQRWLDIPIPPSCTRESGSERVPRDRINQMEYSALVLCSFRGRLLIRLSPAHGGHLILGDPLADDEWEILPPLPFFAYAAALCPLDGTLLACDFLPRTATLAAGATSWDVDTPISEDELLDLTLGDVQGHIVWAGDAFYAAFGKELLANTELARMGRTVARYDLKRQPRRWRDTLPDHGLEWLLNTEIRHPVELDGRLVIYKDMDSIETDIAHGLYEFAAGGGSGGELEGEPVPLLDKQIKSCLDRYRSTRDVHYESLRFYGNKEFLMWDSFRGMYLVYSFRDQQMRQLPLCRFNSVLLPTRCLHKSFRALQVAK